MSFWNFGDQSATGGGGGGAVDSVFGRTGAVTAQAGDYSSFYPQLSANNTFTGTGNTSFAGNLGVGETNPANIGGTKSVYFRANSADADMRVGIGNDAQAYAFRCDGGDSDKFKIRDVTSGADRITMDVNGSFKCETTSGAFYTPRVTTTQMNALTGMSDGAEVYNLTTHSKFYYDGNLSSWVEV